VRAKAATPPECPLESAEELYDQAPCGYLSTLPDGTIVRVNRTLLFWSSFERSDLLGKKVSGLFTVAGRIYCETHWFPLLRMQGFANEVAFELVRPGREPMPVLISAVQKRDEGGEPIVNRIMIFDASDRRRYERELLAERRRAERADKAKADLLAMIGHDMRTPLSTISTAVQLLLRLAPTEKQLRYLNMLRSASASLLGLANQILDFSQLEAGRMVVADATFDPRALVRETADVLRPMAEKKGLTLRIDVDPTVPTVLSGDADKIRQVLSNIAGNAVKFTAAGSVSIATCVREPALVEFEVSDTGIGIPRDRLESIFEEFTQAGPDIGKQYGGTGLGLTISRRLVELLGGTLQVESEQGKGSRFWFRLPLRAPAP
jgi:signal transduction histidine kinase